MLDRYPGKKLLLPRIQALANLGRFKDAVQLLNPDSITSLESELNEQDPSFAANWAGTLAFVYISAGDKQAARRWIDFGLLKDADNKRLAKMLRMSKQ